jgi:hypothetical protein
MRAAIKLRKAEMDVQLDGRLQEIYDRVPPDEPRSRLEPYKDLILKWRRQGRTYRRI